MSGSNPQAQPAPTGGGSQGVAAYAKARADRLWDLADYALNPWGVFTAFLILVIGAMLLFSDVVGPALQPLISLRVGGWMSLVCTIVIAFYIYALRDEAYRYTHTLSFSARRRRPLPVLALQAFAAALAIAFIIAFGLTAKEQLIAPPGIERPGTFAYGAFPHMVLKLVMTGLMVLGFVFLTVSAGLMAAYEYGSTIDDDSPTAPLYTDEARLKTRVLGTACAQLGFQESEVTISDMRRRGDGGMSLVLHHTGELVEQGETQFREDKTWEIEANYTGELIRVEQKETRQSKVEAFRVQAVLAAVRDALRTDVPLEITGMQRQSDGEVVLQIAEGRKKWLATADRWSRLIALERG
ncbi:MAG: hypothetical protein JXA09_09945 [Anaerolineae bacterium]|nr:hypothetical protein [Anaerolineae bacterium]